jgi:hypothetical protein
LFFFRNKWTLYSIEKPTQQSTALKPDHTQQRIVGIESFKDFL